MLTRKFIAVESVNCTGFSIVWWTNFCLSFIKTVFAVHDKYYLYKLSAAINLPAVINNNYSKASNGFD